MRDRTDESTAGHRPDADCGLAPAVTRGVDRRGLLKFAGATLALMLSPVGHAASASLLAVRVWPSPEYTRITLEGSTKLRYSHMLVQDPDRLVIDLEGVQLDSV
nr:AMIN domain-containing protein [Thauera sp.]